MDSAFLFWDKYLHNQIETSWADFSSAFSSFLQQYGSLILDDQQLLYIKSLIDPDYRNIVKISDYLIFYETFWKIQSKRQALFKNQFKTPMFKIPKQTVHQLMLKVIALANGYPHQLQDLIVTSTHINGCALKKEEILSIGSGQENDIVSMNTYQVLLDDLNVNPVHLRMIWTPYNLYLAQDLSRSFRTTLRIDKVRLDAYMVIRLSESTVFKVKFIAPLPQVHDQLQTYQESLDNQLPELMKNLNKYSSVQEYRSRQVEKTITQEKPNLVIEFIEGPLKGDEYTFKSSESYMIGNSKTCSINTKDQMTQREHCQIKFTDNWQLTHHHSEFLDPTQFGTFVHLANSNQYELNLPSKPHVLHERYKLLIGPVIYQVHYHTS